MVENQFMYHRSFLNHDCTMDPIPDSNECKNCVQLSSSEKSFVFYCETLAEKEIWIDVFSKTKQMHVEGLNTLKRSDLPLNLDFNAPVWIPDSFSNECMNCTEEFGILNRKHHCRACGKLVCHSCSSHGFFIPGQANTSLRLRACDPCVLKIQKQGKLKVTKEIDRLTQRHSSASNLTWSGVQRESMDTMNRLSLILSGNDLTKSCSLCMDSFSLLKWKYVCEKCQRLMCFTCGPTKSKDVILCEPCFYGIGSELVKVNVVGGWSCIFEDS